METQYFAPQAILLYLNMSIKPSTTKSKRLAILVDIDTLPQHVKEGIERSRKQAEAGLLTPHEEVMKKYAKYLGV